MTTHIAYAFMAILLAVQQGQLRSRLVVV